MPDHILKIMKHFSPNDPKFLGEWHGEIYFDDKLIIEGDDYHNGLSYRLAGMINLIDILKLSVELQEHNNNDSELLYE